MKYILMLALLTPIFYFAFRQKKWYLYLLFGLIGFLPEQLSVELHEKLPLLSAIRVLILIVAGFWLWKKWKTRQLILPISLLAFLGINLLISTINLRHGFDEISRMFLYIFERALLVIAIADLVEDRDEIHRCVDFMILGCVAVSVIAIVQTVWEYDIASVLHLVETPSSVMIADRMGMTRAYGTYNAISFGCYCAIMVFFIYFRLENTKKFRYSIAFALTLLAMFCTLTRSAWLCCFGVLFLLVVIRRRKPILRMLPGVGLAILLCVSLCFAQPKLYKAIEQTGKSTVNTVFSVLNIRLPKGNAQDSPDEKEEPVFELDKEFGMNASDPTASRTMQWSAVEYMTQEGELLLGYGYNSYFEGKLYYQVQKDGQSVWKEAHAIDVGFVSLLTESGLIGFVTLMGLLGFMAVESWRRRCKDSQLDYYKLTLYMIPLYLLLNVMSSFLNKPVVWLFIALFYAYKRVCNNGIADRELLLLPQK